MNDEINKYIREHVDDVKKICDGCPAKQPCDYQAILLCMWLPKDYKCKAREFLEQYFVLKDKTKQ